MDGWCLQCWTGVSGHSQSIPTCLDHATVVDDAHVPSSEWGIVAVKPWDSVMSSKQWVRCCTRDRSSVQWSRSVSRTFATPYPPSVSGVSSTYRTYTCGQVASCTQCSGVSQATLNANDILTQTWAMSLDAPMQSGELEAEEGEAMDESPSVGHVTCTYVGGVPRSRTVRTKDVPSLGSELQASLCEVCVDRGSV